MCRAQYKWMSEYIIIKLKRYETFTFYLDNGHGDNSPGRM